MTCDLVCCGLMNLFYGRFIVAVYIVIYHSTLSKRNTIINDEKSDAITVAIRRLFLM